MELKPCPFCGQPAATNRNIDREGYQFYIFCSTCYSQTDYYINPSKAAEAWNQRYKSYKLFGAEE